MRTLGLLCLAALVLPHAAAQEGADPAAPPEPRLVVVLEVDFLLHEQLERLRPWWRGGFRRMLAEGAVFSEARLPYGFTDSAAGVATLATGRLPSEHGIVRDMYYERASERQRHCVADTSARTVSSFDWRVSEGGSATSSRLLSPGWAEHLRRHWPASRSVSISGKGATAALLAGQRPDLALWWDSYGRGFVSSDAFVDELPQWLETWNAAWAPAVRDWTWTNTLPAQPELLGAASDARRGEDSVGGQPAVFPYPASELPEELEPKHWAHLAGRAFFSPLIDELTAEVALKAVRDGGLGGGDAVDLLAIGFSACDLLVQATGPYSVEVTDALLRLDRQLGVLFEGLDQELGAGRWLAVLASDRGVLELPEGSPGADEGGVRLRVRERRRAIELVRRTLQAEFEQDLGANLSLTADEVMLFGLSEEDDAGKVGRRARAELARVLSEQPWVAQAFSREELLAAESPDDGPWLRLARSSYHPDRGADVVLRLAHRHLLGRITGTAGGSPYSYDRRQALIFLGPGFSAGARSGPASSLQALPTVLKALEQPLPAELEGRALLAP